MLTLYGKTWEISAFDEIVVVPTVIGWRTNGSAIFGKGVSRETAQIYPDLAPWYGKLCSEFKDDIGVIFHKGIVFLPVKPLNPDTPWISWKNSVDFGLVRKGLISLNDANLDFPGRLLFPVVDFVDDIGDLGFVESLIHACIRYNYALVKPKSFRKSSRSVFI